MSHAFTNCENLVSLDISNLDTSNVTIMECIFFNCHSLTTLNLYNSPQIQYGLIHRTMYIQPSQQT